MPSVADILYGSFIRYDRMYEMTKYAFYGKTDSNSVNIFIDIYSILKSLYTRGSNIEIKDSYAIASCLINLGIHTRAYFDTRHHVNSKVYLIYGGARPRESFVNYYKYNDKNMLMEDSNYGMKNLIMDNLQVMKILCPYLFDIFCIVDIENEFSVITSSIIDDICKSEENKIPNIIYSKDSLSYQLVAFKPYTFLYRPKKRNNDDVSWVVTKTTLYDAYRYGELGIKKEIECPLDVKMFSIYQAISGVKSRGIGSIKNANTTIGILVNAISQNVFLNGYNAHSIFYSNPNPFERIFGDENIISKDITNRFAAIDLPYQTMVYKYSPVYRSVPNDLMNLYDPQEVRNINDKYFQNYPLDLNRV